MALIVFLFATILLSFIETIGIGVIWPFISFASNPDLIFSKKYTAFVYRILGFESTVNFMLFFAAAIIGFYIFKSLYNIIYSYALNRFSYGKYHFFAYKMFCKSIELSYLQFTDKNIDIIRRNISSEAMGLSTYILKILTLLSEASNMTIMYGTLLFVSWKMTLVLTVVLAANIFVIIKTITKKIEKQGKIRSEVDGRFSKLISITFGNFKIIKLKGREEEILKAFDEVSKERVKISVINSVLSPLPRYFLEIIGIGLLIASVAYILYKYQNASAVIPLISMYVLALYKILPSINNLLSSYNELAFNKRSVDIVYEDLNYQNEQEGNEVLEFKNNILLDNVSFAYNEQNKVINNFNLEIKRGDRVAFIGKSGVGKSTLIDLIIGIYKPEKGQILIDGKELNNTNVKSWRKRVGYIPQSIFLFDGTVAENIVLGEDVREDELIEALKKANIWDFLEKQDGINTKVGDQGVKFSGGQKQRIAIARALYGNPDILVLDEATSALDNDTEAKIMDEIYEASKDKTLLIIAHRLSTIERCERVIEL